MDRSKIGLFVICLFALPFATFGLVALSKSVEQLIDGPTDSQALLGLIFGLVFTGVGVGIIFATVYGRSLVQRRQALQAEFPDEPWKWRADWATGCVKSNIASSTTGAWIMAILWNLVSAPIFWIVPHEAPRRGPVVAIALLFPAVGVGLLIRAVRLNIELREFGRTWFQMDAVPAVVGRELKGNIHARFPHSPEHGIHLQLSCVNRVTTGSGNSRSTWEHILWRGETNIAANQLYTEPGETLIPVSFHIPSDVRQSDSTDSQNVILWMLEAKADVPGVDYRDLFEVPIFHTAQSPAASESPADLEEERTPAARPELSTIQVTQTSEGTEFFFPAARNKSFAASITVFTVIFGGIVFFLTRVHAPAFFTIVFGLFTLPALYISLSMWCGTTRVVIGTASLTVQDGWLGGGKLREYAFSEISAISDRIAAQQGGGTGTPFYDIQMTLQNGRQVALGHTIRDKQETEWILGEMRRLTGLTKPKAMAAGMS